MGILYTRLVTYTDRVTGGYLSTLTARLRASPIGYRLARGAFWGVFAGITSRVLALGMSVIVARVLGRERFGQFGIVQSTVALFGTLAGLGLGLTTTKYVSELRQNDPARAGRLMGLCFLVSMISGGLISAVVWLVAPWLAASTLAEPRLAPLLRVGSALILLGGINGAQTGALVGFEAFRKIAQVNVFSGLASFPLVVGGTLVFGVEGAVWGLVASNGVNIYLNRLALMKEARRAQVPIGFHGCLQERKVLVTFSLPALASGMLAAPVSWLCNAMLVNRPNGYAEMGILSAANQWFYAVLFFPSALVSNGLPILSERLAVDDRRGSRQALALNLKLTAAVVLPVVLLGCLGSRHIMGIYGSAFAGHWLTLLVALATGGVLAIQIPIGQIMIASGRMWLVTTLQVIWAVILCGATWAFLPLGALGVILARLLAWSIHTCLTSAYAWWRLK